jgi:hypothetical protein
MARIWKVAVEAVEPGESGLPGEVGFLTATTWADSSEAAVEKLASYLESLQWQVIGVEQAIPVDEIADPSEETEDMIARTLENRDFIILGTFHTYPVD